MDASESVWSLVSGLPYGERERRLIMALQGYFDESQSDGQVLVLAGYLASAAAWAKFTDEWVAHLKGPPAWPMLKSGGAKRKISLDAEFRRRYEEHYRIISRHVLAEVCVAIPIDKFNKVADEFNLARPDRNPYFLAVNTLISMYAGHAKKSLIMDSLELIFDDRTEKSLINSGWEHYYASMPHRHRKLIEEQPVFRKDYKFRPLQAADFIAYWKREEYLETNTIRGHLGPLLPWKEAEPRYACLYGELDEEGIRKVMFSYFGVQRYGYRTQFQMVSYAQGKQFVPGTGM